MDEPLQPASPRWFAGIRRQSRPAGTTCLCSGLAERMALADDRGAQRIRMSRAGQHSQWSVSAQGDTDSVSYFADLPVLRGLG